jgi:hypothetical protein
VDVTVNPVNDPPTTPGAITSDEALNNDGTFTLNWGASIDVDGDNVTYTLEKRDANDANWSPVDSGLTASSYTFGSGNALDEGTWDFRVKAVDSPAGAESDFSTAENLVKVDKSAPSIPVATTTPGSPVFDGWFKDTVKVSYAGSTDPALLDTSAGSGVASYNPADETFNTSGSTHSYSGTATDNAGNVSDPVTGTVKVDATNPTFGACTGGPFTQGSGSGSASVSITANDAHSGLDNAGTTLSGTVNTSTIGDKTFTFTAKDNVGHTVTKDCTYHVNYNWSGFFRPVDNPETVNSVKAGSAIPVKFSLAGNQGLNIFAANFPASQKITCDTSDPVDLIEETVTAGGSSLSYDSSLDQYNYVWKSDKSWAGTCRQLTVKTADGTPHIAIFKFLK